MQKGMLIPASIAVSLGLTSGAAICAQDRYTLKVPNGLAFSEFKGYEGWPVIAISENNGLMAVILGNPVMIDAYTKRFADSGGWGWGAFEYDSASDHFTPATEADKPPQGHDAQCGFACHTVVKGRDYVFTDYAKR